MAGKISNQTRVKGIKCKALMHPYRSRDWRSNSWVAQRLHAELQCPVTPPAYHVAAHHCVSLPTVDHVGRRRRTGQNRRPTRSTGNKDKLTVDVVKELQICRICIEGRRILCSQQLNALLPTTDTDTKNLQMQIPLRSTTLRRGYVQGRQYQRIHPRQTEEE